jgi:hypothetical protein
MQGWCGRSPPGGMAAAARFHPKQALSCIRLRPAHVTPGCPLRAARAAAAGASRALHAWPCATPLHLLQPRAPPKLPPRTSCRCKVRCAAAHSFPCPSRACPAQSLLPPAPSACTALLQLLPAPAPLLAQNPPAPPGPMAPTLRARTLPSADVLPPSLRLLTPFHLCAASARFLLQTRSLSYQPNARTAARAQRASVGLPNRLSAATVAGTTGSALHGRPAGAHCRRLALRPPRARGRPW